MNPGIYTKQECESTPSGHVIVKMRSPWAAGNTGTSCTRCGIGVAGVYTTVDDPSKVPDELGKVTR